MAKAINRSQIIQGQQALRRQGNKSAYTFQPKLIQHHPKPRTISPMASSVSKGRIRSCLAQFSIIERPKPLHHQVMRPTPEGLTLYERKLWKKMEWYKP